MGERVVLERLTKIYAGGSRALDEVSIVIEPGTFLVLLGPSGSGKTTLLRSVAGIERATSGTITIGELMVAGDHLHLPPERRDLSMVFQDYALWPHLVARDNVAFALRRRNIRGERARELASSMLERVGLGHLGERYPNELSGGEQQRVALARALVADTGLVLCDEPLSNLDADLRERMRLEIASLVREAGATAIYITHDQAEAFALADVVGVLEHGQLVQIAPPEQIYSSPVSPFVARFTGLAGELAVAVVSDHSDGVATVAPEGLPSATRLICQRRRGSAGLRRGTLMIRAAALHLVGAEDPMGQLQGQISDVAFRGRGYEHAVTLVNGVQLSGIFSATRGRRGDRVGLRVDPNGAHLFGDAANSANDEEIPFDLSTGDAIEIDISKEFTTL